MSELNIVLLLLLAIVIVGVLGAFFDRGVTTHMERSYKNGSLQSVAMYFKNRSEGMLRCKGLCVSLAPVIYKSDWTYSLDLQVAYTVGGKKFTTCISPYSSVYSWTQDREAFDFLKMSIERNAELYVWYNIKDPSDSFIICKNLFSWRDVEVYKKANKT